MEQARAGRTSKVVGSLLFALGSVTMVGALVTPAAADPGGNNGNSAYGHSHNEKDATVTSVAPAADQQAATDTGSGANQDCGAYCPSGVGLPSGNGNGDGNATGKPCAGCVGNADSKNPPGQAPDGSDHNNGYECDGNNGIGKTNPAHSGCQTTTTMPQTTTTTKVVPCTGSSCEATTTTQPTTTTTVVPCTGDACGTTTTTAAPCTGDNCSTTTTVGTNVLGEQFNRPSSSTGALAFTGSALGKLFFAGMAIALIGIVVMAHRARMAQGSRG